MTETADELTRLAREVSASPHPRELDMLASAGACISNALCAMAIHNLGYDAVSLEGAQAGIITDANHTRASFLRIRGWRIRDALAEAGIVLLSGSHGVTEFTDEVTTLGLSGSDTAAVALASALDATSCEIFSDTELMFTAAPRIVPEALALRSVTYDELFAMTSSGVNVISPRAIEDARRHDVTLRIRSTADDGETSVGSNGSSLNDSLPSCITHDTTRARVWIEGLPHRAGMETQILRLIGESGASIGTTLQGVGHGGGLTISLTVAQGEVGAAIRTLERVASQIGARRVIHDPELATISVIGTGISRTPRVAATIFRVLMENGVDIELMSRSTTRVSCAIRLELLETAVRALHSTFRPLFSRRAHLERVEETSPGRKLR